MTPTWRLAPPRDGTQHTIDLLVDDTMLAAIRYEFDAEKAAAHLMVAAPELLAALHKAREFVQAELDVRVDSHTIGGDLSTLDEADGGICGEAIDMLAVIDAALTKAAAP